MTINKPVVAILHTWCGPNHSGNFLSRSVATFAGSYTPTMDTGVCNGSQQSRDELMEAIHGHFCTRDMVELRDAATLVEYERKVSSKGQL